MSLQVSWVRHRDVHLLTVGRYTYTSDQRFRAIHQPHSEDWTLQIKYPQHRDSGVYECQVSSTPHLSHFIHLTVIEQPIFIVQCFFSNGERLGPIRHPEFLRNLNKSFPTFKALNQQLAQKVYKCVNMFLETSGEKRGDVWSGNMGWRKQEGLEGVQGKYLKWVLGVDRETPGFIVMEETKRDGIRIEAGKRAIRFEGRVIERGECRILQECLKEKKKEIGKGVWKEREGYFERNGYAGAEMCKCRKEERELGSLGRESRKERVIIARFRCGNEERENKYWKEDRTRVCRMCGEKKETIEHLLNECLELREGEESREEILNEDGKGIEWMKKVERRRRTICGVG
ncbi:hypothetical protein GEV33_002297 [Tenebrio molitor]|uniref:Ig-like domain-containing protein n=1 Tax=Tenebrio molitor TaxID=7067 RepID=A0A8J6LEY6_TENMO|nr:hypothetical protein GEV33_002297 [Tenebrio molitor]